MFPFSFAQGNEKAGKKKAKGFEELK